MCYCCQHFTKTGDEQKTAVITFYNVTKGAVNVDRTKMK